VAEEESVSDASFDYGCRFYWLGMMPLDDIERPEIVAVHDLLKARSRALRSPAGAALCNVATGIRWESDAPADIAKRLRDAARATKLRPVAFDVQGALLKAAQDIEAGLPHPEELRQRALVATADQEAPREDVPAYSEPPEAA
jgi:hypothetical protein